MAVEVGVEHGPRIRRSIDATDADPSRERHREGLGSVEPHRLRVGPSSCRRTLHVDAELLEMNPLPTGDRAAWVLGQLWHQHLERVTSDPEPDRRQLGLEVVRSPAFPFGSREPSGHHRVTQPPEVPLRSGGVEAREPVVHLPTLPAPPSGRYRGGGLP
ncbi:MAG: hypothetical protein JW751_02465 [Polyangiaceae bacterium]|nr:hypothetical protein [Polyangiaceae bacterium]